MREQITKPHPTLEPRVIRLEEKLELLTEVVNDLVMSIKDSNKSVSEKLDKIMHHLQQR